MGLSRKSIVTALLFLICAFMMIAKANARIDLLTASFETDWVDLDIDGIKLERHYSSRSTHNGLFGYGWCSSLESSIEFTLPPATGTSLYLTGCDRRIEYRLQVERGEWTSADGSWIARRDDELILHGKDRSMKTFSGTNGRMIAWTGPSGRKLSLEYDRRGLLQDAATGEGLRLRLTMDPLRVKIRSIQVSGPLKATLEYGYSGLDLVKTRNAWSNTYFYSYDSLHNLTHIAYPDQTSEDLEYDTDRDQVLLYRGRKGCRENYSYTSIADRTIAEATKYCGGIPTGRLKLEIDSNTIAFTRNGVKQIQEIAR